MISVICDLALEMHHRIVELHLSADPVLERNGITAAEPDCIADKRPLDRSPEEQPAILATLRVDATIVLTPALGSQTVRIRVSNPAGDWS